MYIGYSEWIMFYESINIMRISEFQNNTYSSDENILALKFNGN